MYREIDAIWTMGVLFLGMVVAVVVREIIIYFWDKYRKK